MRGARFTDLVQVEASRMRDLGVIAALRDDRKASVNGFCAPGHHVNRHGRRLGVGRTGRASRLRMRRGAWIGSKCPRLDDRWHG